MRSTAGKNLFEKLESRQLFSSVNYTGGILNITGNSTTKTVIDITKDWTQMAITDVVQRTTIARIAQQIGKTTPSMIRITLGSASDKVVVDPDVKIPVFVDSGGGNDSVNTGAGNDTVTSGSGNDVINTGIGSDYVLAGSGNDTVTGNSHDTIWGQAGNDVVKGALDTSNLSPATFTEPGIQIKGGGGTQEFSVSPVAAQQIGFGIVDVEVATVTGSTVGANLSVPVTLVSQNVTNGNGTEVFTAENGGIIITATMKTLTGVTSVDATVTNNTRLRVTQLVFNMPRVYANVTSNFKTMSGFRGGTIQDWPMIPNTSVSQDGGTWPGVDYSPLAAFYDSSNNNGVGMIAFNNQLDTTKVVWNLTTQMVVPSSIMWPNLDEGQSVTFNMALVSGTNMPSDVSNYYRNMYLAPYMATLGIPEATYKKTGVWAMSDWTAAGALQSTVNTVMSQGASGFVQWSSADGATSYYEPFDPSNLGAFPWTPNLLATSKTTGLQGLGVLIDPFESTRIHNPDGSVTQNTQSLDSPTVQALLKNQRNQMVSLGVNFAFWDTGGSPRNGSAMGWVNQLWDFKSAGITVAPESSCDIAAWITGADIQAVYTFNSFAIAKEVTPNSTMFAVQNFDQSEVINGQTVQWWDDAQSKGVVPILTLTQMEERAVGHGLT
jgi:hypothetical protein